MHENLRKIVPFRPFYRDFEGKFMHKLNFVLFYRLLPVKAADGVGIWRGDMAWGYGVGIWRGDMAWGYQGVMAQTA